MRRRHLYVRAPAACCCLLLVDSVPRRIAPGGQLQTIRRSALSALGVGARAHSRPLSYTRRYLFIMRRYGWRMVKNGRLRRLRVCHISSLSLILADTHTYHSCDLNSLNERCNQDSLNARGRSRRSVRAPCPRSQHADSFAPFVHTALSPVPHKPLRKLLTCQPGLSTSSCTACYHMSLTCNYLPSATQTTKPNASCWKPLSQRTK